MARLKWKSNRHRIQNGRVLAMFLCVVLPVIALADESFPPLPEGAFSIVALPDTQAYCAGAPEILAAEVEWILGHIKSQNIVFVTHVGDIVDKNTDPAQWAVAREQLGRLHGRVPFGLAVGNHDMHTGTGDSANFQASFPASDFAHYGWYGGNYRNNANSWQTFRAGGMDFLIVHIECNAPDDVLAWADGVIARHPEHRLIVTTHMYLGPVEKPTESRGYFDAPKGRMAWKKCHGAAGNTPREMWDKCFSRHANLCMIFCGDQSRTQAWYQTATGRHGNTVHELMSDYREGYFRVYRFLPAEDRVDVFTYSPVLGKLCDGTSIVPEPERHQFSFPLEMRPEHAGAAHAETVTNE